MAVSISRRRIIAIIFAICLATALFLYRRGAGHVHEVNVIEADISRLDLSKETTTEMTTIPMSTKHYSVVFITEKTDTGVDKIITNSVEKESPGLKKEKDVEDKLNGMIEEGKGEIKLTEHRNTMKTVNNESSRKDESRREKDSRRKEEEPRRREEESRRKQEESRKNDEESRGKQEDSRRKEEESRRKEEESRRKEEESRRNKEESRRKEEESRRNKEESRRKEEDSRRKQDESRRKKDESRKNKEESRRKKDEYRRKEESRRNEDESHRKEEESRRKQDESRRTEEESRRRQEDLRRKEESRRKQEESRKKQDESRRKQAESRRKQEESRRKQEESRRKEEESRKKEEESRRKQEESRRKQAESRRKQEESRRKQEESRRKEEESRKKEEESRRKQEESRRKQEESRGNEQEYRRKDESRRNEEESRSSRKEKFSRKEVSHQRDEESRMNGELRINEQSRGRKEGSLEPRGRQRPGESVQREIAMKSSSLESSPALPKQLVPTIVGVKTAKDITVPVLDITTKPSWADRTTKMSNPRLEKIREPTKMPTVRFSSSTATVRGSSPEEPLACKIPALDPFHPHVARLQNNVGTNLRKICRAMHPYTPVFKVVNNKLVLKENVKQNSIVKSSIELKEIKRQGDQSFRYEKAITPFVGLLDIHESKDIGQSDFFRVEYKIDGRRASDLYARVSPKLDLVEKQNKIAEQFQDKGLQLNVLILGFDSTSRANFVRKLPRVKSFLETELNTYFMEGMSIVGDATTPVLAAMLTGKDETKLPEGRTSFGGRPIDNWPWIMKDYERQGYITLYAEDDPSVSAFNLRLEGFSKQPTHHYMRPFWLSLEDMHERDEPGRCSKSESMVNHTLKYINSFFDAYPTSRKFAFAFHSYLAHAHPNHLSFAEDDLMWLLRTFVNKGYLKDTMLVIMGDHGSRNSEYRDTMQGKLEERLPWFSISLPSEFHRKFPQLTANLQKNQAVITSSFDVHATLRHILTYPSTPRGEHTQSLFQRLPRNRTCKDAGIAEHWCPCFQWLPTDVNSGDVQRIAASALKVINEKISKEPLVSSCHKLTLDGVVDAIILQANKKVRTFYSTNQDSDRRVNFADRTTDLKRFQIIFTTQPNGAKYEVTAHVSGQQVTVNPEISRLNRYNDQPACIAKQYPYARKFCYCKTRG